MNGRALHHKISMSAITPLPSSPTSVTENLNTSALRRRKNENPSSSQTGEIDGVAVAQAVTPTSLSVQGSLIADVAIQEGTTEQQHCFDVYNNIQTTLATTSLATGAGILKVTSLAALLGAHAPIVGVALIGFGAAGLFNAATDRFFRPNY